MAVDFSLRSLVLPAIALTLTACGGGGGGSAAGGGGTGGGGASQVTIEGRLTYERPNENFLCRGYDFSALQIKPVRLAKVFLLDSSDTVLANGATDIDGNYSFSNIPANTNVRVRVRAESTQPTGDQTWEVYVRDNTSDTTRSLPNRPPYEIQWALFNSGSNTRNVQDFTARTGWSGGASGSYTGNRAAAPLAILDSLLEGVLLVTDVDPVVDMGRLDAFWSVNNTYSRNDRLDDPDNGELVTAYYVTDPEFDGIDNPSLFLRGDAIGRLAESTINTDEFDEYVVLHEWGHYFEAQLSRSDSRGGYHIVPGTVDPLVAFGEGWGHAIGAIAPNDPTGCDTGHPTTSGSDWDMESFDLYASEQGFYNEMSMATFLWDLYDTNNDGADNDSIGFAPIYEAMTRDGMQKDTPAMTTVFSFATYLRQVVDPVDIAFIDAQLERENVDTANLNEFATGQTTIPVNWRSGQPVNDLLPVFTQLAPGNPPVNRCVNIETREADSHNNPGKWRYLYFTLDATRTVTLTTQANPVPPPTSDTTSGVRDRSDPDFWVLQEGRVVAEGRSGDSDQESLTLANLAAGTYVVEFHDWRHVDEVRANDYPERVCFDFTLN